MKDLGWSPRAQGFVLGGALVLAVGSFLPWVKVTAGAASASKNGIDGDGVLTLILAVAIVAAMLLIRSPKAAGTTALVMAVVAGAVAVYDGIDIADESGLPPGFERSIGIGVIVCVVGAAAAAFGAFLGRSESSSGPPIPPPPPA